MKYLLGILLIIGFLYVVRNLYLGRKAWREGGYPDIKDLE